MEQKRPEQACLPGLQRLGHACSTLKLLDSSWLTWWGGSQPRLAADLRCCRGGALSWPTW